MNVDLWPSYLAEHENNTEKLIQIDVVVAVLFVKQ